MRIRLSENVESIRAETPTRASTLPHATTGPSTSVELSSTARALTAALAQELLATAGTLLQDVLLEHDRVLLTWASQLLASGAQDEPGEQLEPLARELVLFRRQALAATAPGALSLLVSSPLDAAPQKPLSLPLLSREDEALARSLLLRIGSRETVLDRDFVRSLVEPERGGRSVSLRFLHRLVTSLWPRTSVSEPHAHALIARRDARITLTRALSQLALSHDALSATTPAQRALGEKRLGAQLTALTLEDRGADATPRRPFASLTRNDRALLALLHAAEIARGAEGGGVAQVLEALLTLRHAERAELSTHAREPQDERTHSVPADAHRGADALAPPRDLAGEQALRGCESRAQLAARVASSYRGLALEREGVSPAPLDVLREAVRELPASAREGERGGRVLAYLAPLDLTQALGLGALVAQSHVRALRARRTRRRRNDAIRALRAIERRRRRHDTREELLDLRERER